MKKKYIIFLLLTILLALSACSQKDASKNADMVYTADLYGYVRRHKGTDNYKAASILANEDRYSIGVHVPVTGYQEADYFLSSMAKSMVNDFKNEMATWDKGETKGVLFGDYSVYEYDLGISVRVTFEKCYPNGKASREYHSVYYSLVDNKVITSGDFLESNVLAPIATLVATKLDEIPAISEKSSEKFYTELSLTDASNLSFFIEKDTVYLYFNPSSLIKAYTEPIELVITKEELLPFLTKNMANKIFLDGDQE